MGNSNQIRKSYIPIYAIWIFLSLASIYFLINQEWQLASVAFQNLVLTIIPFLLRRRFHLHIPRPFLAAIVVFITASMFFGEASDFYERFWWWDVVLHGISALGFGIIGFVIILYLIQSSKITASALLISIFSFSFAIAIGVLWEIFEFSMDQIFGMNMQKSGLMDTMTDFIIDCIGAAIASFGGYMYLHFGPKEPVGSIIHAFFVENKHIFRSKLARLKRSYPKN